MMKKIIFNLSVLILIAGGLFFWLWCLSGTLPVEWRNVFVMTPFETAARLPAGRTESGGAALDGKFYIVGGIDALAQTLTSFYVYDPASDSWEKLPDLPQKINHAAVVGAQGKLYVAGGFGPLGLRLRGFMFARWDPLDTLYVYDPVKREWTLEMPLPKPRGAGGIALLDNALWYAGGVGEDLEVKGNLFRYDLQTKNWSEKKAMPTARDHLRVEAAAGKLYSISGRKDDLRFNYATVERYDPVLDQWSRATDIPLGRGGLGSASDGRFIYTFGGEQVWTCVHQYERYDAESNTWQVMGLMPETRHGIVAGRIGRKIHLVSGGVHPRVSISDLHRVLNLDALTS
jgi:N-acetylneuraminic acid mutarotase